MFRKENLLLIPKAKDGKKALLYSGAPSPASSVSVKLINRDGTLSTKNRIRVIYVSDVVLDVLAQNGL